MLIFLLCKSLNTHGILSVYLLCRLLTVSCFQTNRFGEIVNSGSQSNSKVQSTLSDNKDIFKKKRRPESAVVYYKTDSGDNDWSDDWLLLFNILKSKFVQYRLVKFVFNYQMRDSKGDISSLSKDSEEKDLGITFKENLKFNKQILESVGMANKILGLIKRSFVHIDCELLLKLYKSLVRPIVDYGNVIWYPYIKKKK